MRRATDTLMRSLAMLQSIPVHPQSKSTSRICEDLRTENPDYDVTQRTVQRNLDQLSARFPISCEARGRTNHWFWTDRNALTQIPKMGPTTAFVLRMAVEHLQSLMPPTALEFLGPYLRHADDVLNGTELGRWPEKAAIIDPGLPLIPPAIDSGVQDAVYRGLMTGRRIEATYRSRSRPEARQVGLDPLGIVVRRGVVYLVATVAGEDHVRHYALHRMRKARATEDRVLAPQGFRLSSHIRSERQFSYPQSAGKLELRLLFDGDVGDHLKESRLSTDQRTTDQPDGRILVEARVPDTADLRWWLLGFGPSVEILEPAGLRDEFRERTRTMAEIYG